MDTFSPHTDSATAGQPSTSIPSNAPHTQSRLHNTGENLKTQTKTSSSGTKELHNVQTTYVGPFSRKIRKIKRIGFFSQLFCADNLAHIPLGFLFFFAGLTLILMVSLPALISVERNEVTLTRLLAEKGSSLIMAFENSLRTGMRSQTGVRLQILLEEMATGHDITFIAVTMPDGTIIAHSNRARVGEIINIDGKEADESTMHQLSPQGSVRWSIMQMEGSRSFVVYRNFLPGRLHGPHHLPIPMIFLGLDVSPFEITKSTNRAYVTMLAGVSLLVGLASLLALYYAERARQSRSRQRLAEDKVRVLEEEVRRKEKLAAVGNLAAGVAHEIRNPLSSIKGYATYFGMRFPEGSEDRKAAAVMVHEVERLNLVITELIGLSKPTDVSLRPTQVEAVIDHVTKLLAQDAAHRGIKILIRLPRKLPLALADPDRLGQALLNLCLNAFDAMPGGGRLTLAVSSSEERVCLIVQDTGTGISTENLQHIFDPYFTTKPKGTGIGLPTVHKIVEALKGEISVDSHTATEKRKGETVFRIWLPTVRNEIPSKKTAASAPARVTS